MINKKHELKILPEFYEEVISGRKNFELRKDDRGFCVGDQIILKEFKNGEFTGRRASHTIKYILRNCPEYGLQDGYCIIGF